MNNEGLIKNVLEIISGYVDSLGLTPNNIRKKYEKLLEELNNNKYLNISLVSNLVDTNNISYYLTENGTPYGKVYFTSHKKWKFSKKILLNPKDPSDFALIDSLGNLFTEQIGNTYYSEMCSNNTKSGCFKSFSNNNIIGFLNLTV